jgi:DNA-binding HxlR family transcriptional regulator
VDGDDRDRARQRETAVHRTSGRGRGLSGKVLADTWRDLERDGLLTRHLYAEVPPRVEYELTALGRTLHAPLRAIGTWAEEHIVEEHIVEELEARDAYDASIGPTGTTP